MGSPDDALDMEVNQTYAEQIDNTDIDHQDWYRFVAAEDGLLTVATKSESGDLILACHGEGDLDLSVRTDGGHFDYPRAKEGGLDAPFMSIYVLAALR